MNNFKKFIKGFGYAFSGLIYCIRTQRNMRVHLCAAFYVLLYIRLIDYYDYDNLSKADIGVIILTIGLVIALEAVNTAIESCIDLFSEEKSRLAKIAKDTAAAAVLIAAFAAIGVAVVILWNDLAFAYIALTFGNNPKYFAGLLVSILLWILFIFAPDYDKNKKNKKEK